MIKSPNVAGAFYPATKEEILAMMDQFFANVHEEKPIKNLKAIVCPHAGYIYSGQVAAYSYKALEDHLRSKHSNLSTTFVILAPSHYEYFNGVSVGLYEAFETPLGTIPVDTKLGQKLINNYPDYFSFVEPAYEQEHSYEVQLPFLQYIGTGNYKILPLVFGNVNPIEVGKILFEFSKKDHGPGKGNIFFIVSSDLSHFMNYENAVQIDEITLDDFVDRDIDKIVNEAEACGIHPWLALTQLAIQSKRTPQLLKYMNSGDVTGDRSRVVGYGSIIYHS